MATEIIASGTAAASSVDVVLADGASTTVLLRAPDSLGSDYRAAHIELKDSTGGYIRVASMTRGDPAKQVNGPVTFRVRRELISVAVAVDRD